LLIFLGVFSLAARAGRDVVATKVGMTAAEFNMRMIATAVVLDAVIHRKAIRFTSVPLTSGPSKAVCVVAA